MSSDGDDQAQIWMESGVSTKDGHPFITLTWGGEKGQLSPAEVRIHALALLEAAEAAETDALLLRAMTREGGPYEGDPRGGVGLIAVLRAERMEGFAKRG